MSVPAATYRLQLARDFDLRAARELAPYLRDLGVTHVFLSPVLAARRGSPHGYDVVDPGRIDEDRGGRAALDELSRELRRLGLGVVLDVVPNHMATGPENPRWMDLLAHGQASRYARWFDVRWQRHPADPEGEERLLLPILARPLDEALQAGELRAALGEEGLVVRAPGRRLPLDPGSWDVLLEGVPDLAQLALETRALPPWWERDPERAAAWARLADVLRRRLREAVEHSSAAREALERRFEELSPEELGELLARQPWRPCDWRIASRVMAYRRFFDIGDLVGVRVEDEEVFAESHALVLELVRAGAVDGLRIDHVDGLADPLAYLERLREALAEDAGGGETYVVVEKILTGTERLPEEWPVAGTTGYELANDLGQVFVDPRGLERLRRGHAEITVEDRDFEEQVRELKERVARELFAGELVELSAMLAALAAKDAGASELTAASLQRALLHASAGLPVYRTYVAGGRVSERDRALVHRACEVARDRAPAADEPAIVFLERALLLEAPADPPPDVARERERFVSAWQQFTGPLAAKGVEDTALYRDVRLTALNEVGVDPHAFAAPAGVADFLRRASERAEAWPRAMLSITTHDTKRSGDARVRIAALSEMADEWLECVRRWRERNAPLRRRTARGESPDALEELFLYQSLLGIWPLDDSERDELPDRLASYALKAAREAKRNTSWIDRDREHEEGLEAFARAIASPGPFQDDFRPTAERAAFLGMLSGLSQALVHLASPGVPDLYQGTELWLHALVDPDNRRPVDWSARRLLLAELDAGAADGGGAARARAWLDAWRDGRPKLLVTALALRARREDPELFRDGELVPLAVSGEHAENVCAFARRRGDRHAIVLAPRLAGGLGAPGDLPLGEGVWGDTAVEVPAGSPPAFEAAFTGERITSGADGRLRLADALPHFPVALLLWRRR